MMGYSVDALASWLLGLGVPGALALALAIAAVWAGPLMGLVLGIASLGQIVERKLAAAMQRRLGPNSVGLHGIVRLTVHLALFFRPREERESATGWLCGRWGIRQFLHVTQVLGLGQLAADGVKMIGKEDLVPAGADGWVFRAAPYLALVGAFLPWAAMPFAHHLVAVEMPAGAVFVIAAGGLVPVGLLMAGWGSANKWSLLGGMRAVAQIVSYEIPVALCLAAVAMWSGTLDLHGIVALQYREGAASFLGWNLLQSPFMVVLAGVYVVGGLAECQRTPFDMAEAESELVSGFNTEYSGLRWGMFAMAEYVDILLVGALFATFFLGGYQSPLGEQWIVALPAWASVAIHLGIFTGKCVAMLVLFVWLRWTLPRFRIDQVMRLAWTRLTPLALLSLCGLAATMVMAGGGGMGPAYGRLAPLPRLDYGIAGIAGSWLVAGGGIIALVWLARRAAGREQHPALRRLTGAP